MSPSHRLILIPSRELDPFRSHNTTLYRPSPPPLDVFSHGSQRSAGFYQSGGVVPDVVFIYGMVDPRLAVRFSCMYSVCSCVFFGQLECVSCRYQHFWPVGLCRPVRGISHVPGQKNQHVPRPRWLYCKNIVLFSVCSPLHCFSSD